VRPLEPRHGDQPQLELAPVELCRHDLDVVDAHDVGMIEPSERACLREHRRVALHWPHLERHGSVQTIVECGDDEPARAATENVLDDVARAELRLRGAKEG
jgi:hypothetical protein